MTAIAAMKALHDHGRQVPQDCSIIAIDGLTMSEYAIPTLTTMIQPAGEIGRESVEVLMDMVKNSAPPRCRILPARLRAGASVQRR